MNTNRRYSAVAGILICALAVVTLLYTNQAPANQTSVQESDRSTIVSLTIQSLYTHKPINAASDETVLDVLRGLNAQDPDLALTVKEYSGMGTLVIGMHGLANGTDQKYWQYKVNDVVPQIGADTYKLKNGDSLEWYFDTSKE